MRYHTLPALGITTTVLASASLAYERPLVVRDSSWEVGQVVQTTSGPVQGHAASNASDVSEYLGIPYAEPPVGNLRFQAPVRFNGTKAINGSAFGFSCMSGSATGDSVNNTDGNKLGITPTGMTFLQALNASPTALSEDCLTLNVWTKPQTGEAKKAVLMFIYGGAFVSGSSSIPWYNGKFFADQEDVIVVTFNYRISIFGFPGIPSNPSNVAMLDQRMAVEWVRDNIEAFGGDPRRIVLFGQSAGGASVDYYSYAWASDPIAHGFIPESGTATAFGQQTPSQAAEAWFNVTATLGCGGDSDDHDAVLQCMLGKPAGDIANATPVNFVAGNGDGNSLAYGPTIDEKLVFSNYSARKPAAAGVLVGNTNFEAGLFRLLAPSVPEEVWPTVNLKVFVCPAADRAAKSVAFGNPTWRYRYFGVFPNLILTTSPSSGAWHASELPVLFGFSDITGIPDTSEEIAIGRYVRGAWAAFAKDPVRGLTSYEDGWPQYSPNASTLIRLGFNNRTGANLGVGTEYDSGCTLLDLPSGDPAANGTSTPSPSPSPTIVSGGERFGVPSWLFVAASLLVGIFAHRI